MNNLTPEQVSELKNKPISKLTKNTEDLPPEFSKAISDNFWDLALQEKANNE